MILTLTYASTVPQAVDRGCFSFLLIKNGRMLEGQGAFYYSPEHQIKAAPVILSRKDTHTPRQLSKRQTSESYHWIGPKKTSRYHVSLSTKLVQGRGLFFGITPEWNAVCMSVIGGYSSYNS